MGYHHCPIEPSDWSDGPNDDWECPRCNGEGLEFGETNPEPCMRCGGLGYLTNEDYTPLEYEYDPEDKS